MLLTLAAAAPCVAPPPPAERFAFDRERVLGTTLHLEVEAEDEAAARVLEAAVLDELSRLAALLGSHDPESEWRRAAAAHAPTSVSPELFEVLRLCDDWRRRSAGAFQPDVGALVALWREAARTGVAPEAAALARAARPAGEAPWRLDEGAHTVEVTAELPPTLDALAKGWAIDRACAVLRAAGCVRGLVEVGGDLRVLGDAAVTVAVADPWRAADNAPPLETLALPGRAAATSGGYARGFDVAGVHHSHVLDPRSGLPADRVAQATVVAPDCATADALATILCVLPPEEGLALVAGLEGVECLVLAQADHARHASAGWAALVADTAAAPAQRADAWAAGHVELHFTLAEPPTGGGEGGRRRRGGYRRPYVAAWVEDADGKAVRTLALWVQQRKWIPDLRRWIRHYRDREGEVVAVTRATRGPGEYTLEWRGEDDDGRGLPAGDYTICLEVVREHGGTSMLRRALKVDGSPFQLDLEAGGEVAAARVEFVLLAAPGVAGEGPGGGRE